MSRSSWLAALLAGPLLACTTMSAGDTREAVRQATEDYQARHYRRSAEAFAALAERGEQDASLAYNATCGYALAGDVERAFQYLRVAIERGFDDVEHLTSDPDLHALHADARWSAELERARAARRQRELRWNTPAFTSGYREDLPPEEKLAGLAKLWAEVRYNFVWFEHVPELDWDAAYLSAIPRVLATASTQEYYQRLQELCARLKDGHTEVVPPPELRARQSRPLLSTRWVEGRVLVVDVQDAEAARDGVRPGWEILEVEGLPVQRYAQERITPWQSASTPQDLDSRTYERALLRGPAGEPVPVTFATPEGEHLSRSLRRPAPDAPGAAPPAPFDYRLLADNVAYVALGSFADASAATAFEHAFEALSRSDALVLDLRDNGGGDSSQGYRILSLLTARPFKGSRWRAREYRPVERAWGRPERFHGEDAEELPPDGKRLYDKPVVLLTSPRTASAAEDFAVAFDAMGRGRVVGEPTAGTTGQPLSFSLPGGGSARVCVKQDAYPDGRPFVGLGVRPHLLVRPTVSDIRAGRDTVLEAALAELRRTRAGR